MNSVLLLTLGYWLGISLCTGIVGGGIWNHWQSYLRRRRQQQNENEELAQFRQEVETRRKCFRALDPTLAAWNGTRTFHVATIVDECQDCRSFYLLPSDKQPLPSFLPGQYLTLELPQPGVAKPLVRCYSLSDRPGQEFYRITVKRILSEKPSQPPGRGSNFLFDHVQVGSKLSVRAPAGTFFLNPLSREPIVLIASGIGITPILAMLNEIVHEQPGRPVVVFLGMRNSASFPFRKHLRQLVAEHRNVTLSVSFSRPSTADVLGRDYDHHGRLSLARILQVLGNTNHTFYLCGAGGMMAELVPALESAGVPAERLHFEAFGPSTVKRLQPAGSSPTRKAKVKFVRTQREIQATGTQSLLELAEGEGIPIESGCRAGNCGQCVARLITGKVRTNKKPGIKLSPDQCLTCISFPDGDLQIDI